jgi:hypothetical protein
MEGISLHNGARVLSKGLRTSSAGLAAVGAAILALVAIRRIEAGEKPVVYRTKLRPGESLEIVVSPRDRVGRSSDS